MMMMIAILIAAIVGNWSFSSFTKSPAYPGYRGNGLWPVPPRGSAGVCTRPLYSVPTG